VREGLSEVRRQGRSFSESDLHRLEGELLLLRLERDGAERCFEKAIESARRQGSRSFELRAAVSLARFWRNQDRKQEARRLFEEVYGSFTEGLDTPDLMEAQTFLASLS
jgi:predicted ATPase